LLLPLATVVIQGLHTIVSKMSAGVVAPEAISFYRWVVAIVILTPLLLKGFLREWPVLRPHFGRLVVLSFLGMVSYQGLVYVAAKTTTATNISIIGSTVPLLSVGWAALLLRFRPGPLVLTGCVLSLVGVLTLIERGHPLAVLSQRVEIGDICVLVGGLLYALYGVLLRLWQLPVSARSLFYAQALLAVIITAPGPLIGTASPITWANGPIILVAGIAGSVMAPFLWMLSVQRVGPVASAIFLNFTPVVTALVAVAFLGETFETYDGLGAALIIGGVFLAQWEALRKAAARGAGKAEARPAS
jgi:drug/metabolite transporter (DMT)-like permease